MSARRSIRSSPTRAAGTTLPATCIRVPAPIRPNRLRHERPTNHRQPLAFRTRAGDDAYCARRHRLFTYHEASRVNLNRNLNEPDQIVALLLSFVIATSIHEFMHAWTAHKLGDNTARDQGRITLNPLSHFE